MSVKAKFKTLIRELDGESLDELSRSVASELEGRRLKGAIKIENIHPLMSAEEKRQAMEDIARVLKGNRDA